MTRKDIGLALEMHTSGASIRELSKYYGCDPMQLNRTFKSITKFRNKYDRINNKTVVMQSKINDETNRI